MMYAQLGTVVFEPLPVESLDEKHSYNFAEHQVIEGKPLLQFIGDGLDETSLGLRLHVSFCDPAAAFAQLKAEADQHQALRLIFADGSNLGWRVVTEISRTFVSTADNGRPMCIEAKLQLKEWVDANPLGSREDAQKRTAPALQGKGPIGKLTAAPGNRMALISGQTVAGAKQIDQAAVQINSDAGVLQTSFPELASTAGQIKTIGGQIRTAVTPIMQKALSLAMSTHDSASAIRGYATSISGYSSDLTRVLSGLPGPAGRLGDKMAAANRRISDQAIQATTLSQLADGGAVEANTRARIIARLLPG